MKLIAKCYVKISGRNYTPGEVVEVPANDEKIQRLMRLGAVKPLAVTVVESEEAPDSCTSLHSNEASGEPVEEKVVSEDGKEADLPSDEEDGEDDEAPEIDVSDGLVTETEEADKAKPAKNTRGRKKA